MPWMKICGVTMITGGVPQRAGVPLETCER
jgi:hypothetical protein